MTHSIFVYRLMTGDGPVAEGASIPWAEIDRADGFFHLSTRAQCLETARVHFAGAQGLWALEFEAADLGDALRWDASRDGALFPHYYGDIPRRLVRRTLTLTRDASGDWTMETPA